MMHIRKLREFVSVWRLYARHHGQIYSAKLAFNIVYRGLPF